ncbi:MAG: HAMP domain-containing sensor histidine kinase [Candidatus Cloacimonadaceae bacterium]|nr:HAMP domain-containing sensor histidine kinase [Candidatus Cloacimonadaceae bacterium]
MKQVSKNSIPSGISRKNVNRFDSLRLYIILSSLFIFAFFAIYTQILIQNAKKEQEYVPRLFAQYIAYTDSYLKESEKSTQLLTEIITNYIQFATKRQFQQDLWNYVSTEFMPKNPLPIIITDENREPTIWNNIAIPSTSNYQELSNQDKQKIEDLMRGMIEFKLVDRNRLTGYAYYKRPISFEEFIKKIDYSVIVTNRFKIPLYWRNVDIREDLSFRDITNQEKATLVLKTKNMTEIPLSNEADSLGYIYFTAPTTLSHIRYIVMLELLIALLLILTGSYGLLLLRRTEKDTLWIGLAKETAHQFGTPITSLMGWIDYLKEHPGGFKSKEEFESIIKYMTTDLSHLRNIASRFGKVGSVTKLVPHDLHAILVDVVDYFSKRMPHLGSRIDIHLISKISGVQVMLDMELFKWTLENLIKNCVDAMSKKGGNIIITATQKEAWVYLHIRDDGKGIPRNQWKVIFEPGVTTKTRGWGLGLSLAKRIIDEYHHGHIRVIESTVNEGTTFEIKLHTEGKKLSKKKAGN